MVECPALGTGCLYNSLVLQQVIVCRPSGEAVGPGAGEPRVLLQLPAPGQLLPPRHTGHSGTVEDDFSLRSEQQYFSKNFAQVNCLRNSVI